MGTEVHKRRMGRKLHRDEQQREKESFLRNRSKRKDPDLEQADGGGCLQREEQAGRNFLRESGMKKIKKAVRAGTRATKAETFD